MESMGYRIEMNIFMVIKPSIHYGSFPLDTLHRKKPLVFCRETLKNLGEKIKYYEMLLIQNYLVPRKVFITWI